MQNLKQMPDYYNRKQQTLMDFFQAAGDKGLGAAVSERMAWGEMRMMRTDVEDLQGFIGLINGKTADQNWTGLFEPGERVRLRLINSSAMTSPSPLRTIWQGSWIVNFTLRSLFQSELTFNLPSRIHFA